MSQRSRRLRQLSGSNKNCSDVRNGVGFCRLLGSIPSAPETSERPRKKLIPGAHSVPHACARSRQHAAPTQGRAGRLETGAPVWPGRQSATGLATLVPLDPDPVRKLQIRDGRPLAPRVVNWIEPKAAHYRRRENRSQAALWPVCALALRSCGVISPSPCDRAPPCLLGAGGLICPNTGV